MLFGQGYTYAHARTHAYS